MYVCMYVYRIGQIAQVVEHQTAEPRTFTKGLKRIGTNQGLPPANWGVHTYMAFMLVAGLALQSNDWGVKSVRANSAFHPSGYMSKGEP